MLSVMSVSYFAVSKNNVFMPSSFCQSPTGNSDSEPGEASRPLFVSFKRLKASGSKMQGNGNNKLTKMVNQSILVVQR